MLFWIIVTKAPQGNGPFGVYGKSITSLVSIAWQPHLLCEFFHQSPPKGAKTGAARKLSNMFLTLFAEFWMIFAPRGNVEKCQKYFWHFLTFFDVAPFRSPLLRSADFAKSENSIGGAPPAEPRHEVFPWIFVGFAVHGRGNSGLKFCWSSFFLLWMSKQTKSLQNTNFTQNFALQKPFTKKHAECPAILVSENGCANFYGCLGFWVVSAGYPPCP